MAGRPVCSASPSCMSSKCGIPPKTKRRYKTIENFLRRIAFNLGNTVSQTDVKILSCIPIDVTDLQQKIIQLEKELEEAKENGNENGNKSDRNGKNGKRSSVDSKGRSSVDRGRSSVDKGKRKSTDSSKGKKGEEKPTEEEFKEGITEESDAKEGEAKEGEGAGEGEEKKEGEENKEEKTVARMQIKRAGDGRHKGGTLSAGPNYMRNYLNVDTSENELHSIYKADKIIDGKKYSAIHSISNNDINIQLDRSTPLKQKKNKHSPFSAFKKKKHFETAYRCQPVETKIQPLNRYDLKQSGNSSSYSIILPRSHSDHHVSGMQDSRREYKAETIIGQTDQRINPINLKRRNEKFYQNVFPQSQYIYYAETNSHFNPTYKKNKSVYDCDLSYIASLINKQYSPMNMFNENKLLHRQFSVPVCRDIEYSPTGELAEKYTIQDMEACSCFSLSNSRNNMARDHGFIRGTTEQHTYNNISAMQPNNVISNRYNDATMYDIVPVKQAANKKCEPTCQKAPKPRQMSPNRQFFYKNVDPPFNLYPQKHMSNDAATSDHLNSIELHPHYNVRTAKLHKKKLTKQRKSSPTKRYNHDRIAVDPEDIYLNNNLNANETSAFSSNEYTGITKLSKNKSTEEIGYAGIKGEEKKPDSTITELKTILQCFIDEIKHEAPKTINTTDLNEKTTPGTSVAQANPFACFPAFSSVLPATQCCPILCPLNFIPEACQGQPPGYSHPLFKNTASECCMSRKPPITDEVLSEDLSDTKKLIREIYKSVSGKNDDKTIFKANDIDNIRTEERNNDRNIDQDKVMNETLDTKNKNTESKGCMTCMIAQSVSIDDTTDIESKVRMEEYTDISGSCIPTHSNEVTTENIEEIPDMDDKQKKSSFLRFFKRLRSLSPNRYGGSNTKIDKSSSSEMSTHQNERNRTPYRQKITNYTAMCDHDHAKPRRPRYACQNINTDNPPEDIYDCCYFHNERQKKRTHQQQTCYADCEYDKITTSKYNEQSLSPRNYRDEYRPANRHSGDSGNPCFYLPNHQQIPLCLKEIEVKNAGTQSNKSKKSKLFGVIKKLRINDNDSEISEEVIRPRTKNKILVASQTQTGSKNKKPSFLEILKGKNEIFDHNIYDYNVLDHEMADPRARPQGLNIFFPKHNKQKPSYKTKSKGMWGNSFDKMKKNKKHDVSSLLYKKNPFSLRNIVMRSLIGQKPVPNTQQAKPFF